MKPDPTDHDFEEVTALIREEEEDALAFFRTRNFRDKVEIRLRKAAGEGSITRSQRKAVPLLATALVLIIAGICILVLNRSGTGPPREFDALASALGQLPGFSHLPGRGWTPSPDQTGTFRLAESVRQALVIAEHAKREMERRISIPAEATKIPRLSPDQRVEFLFREKTIERVLLLLKSDSKEV